MKNEKGQFIKGIIPWNKGKKGIVAWNRGLRGFKHSGSFQKGHPRYKKTTKGDFLKGQVPWNKGLSVRLNPKGGFKKGHIPWSKGKKLSQEFREKCRERQLGKKLSEEHKKNIREALRGKKKPPRTEEHKRKLWKFPKGHTPWNKGKKGEGNPNWQGGKSFEPYSSAFTDELKQAVRQRDNFICQICGKYPSFIPHHIDYDKKNNEPENLITLCESCHSKTNFNRSYWINYFYEKLSQM